MNPSPDICTVTEKRSDPTFPTKNPSLTVEWIGGAKNFTHFEKFQNENKQNFHRSDSRTYNSKISKIPDLDRSPESPN